MRKIITSFGTASLACILTLNLALFSFTDLQAQCSGADTEAPNITCPADITADVDAGTCCAAVSIPLPTGTDNCSPITFSNDYNGTDDASDMYFPGEIIVTWTATDESGLTATCEQRVTVIDNEPPVLGYTDEACIAEYETCFAEQQAIIADLQQDLEDFIASCNDDPACLNEAARQALSIDEEARKRLFQCLLILNNCEFVPAEHNLLPDLVVEVDAGSCEAYLNPGPVVMENCTAFTLTNDYNGTGSGEGMYPVGTVVVTWTAVDQYGNSSMVSRSITVTVSNNDLADADCDGVADVCDVCPDGDDSVDANGDGIPDCSQLLPYSEYSEDWKCKNNKINICHNGNTLCISKNALSAHFNHGDAVGPCQSCGEKTLTPPTSQLPASSDVSDRGLQLTVSPNPVRTEVTLDLHGLGDVGGTLRLFDQMGRELLNQDLAAGTHILTLNLPEGLFPSGTYIVNVVSANKILTKSLIIQR